jgi:hypothetical protein
VSAEHGSTASIPLLRWKIHHNEAVGACITGITNGVLFPVGEQRVVVAHEDDGCLETMCPRLSYTVQTGLERGTIQQGLMSRGLNGGPVRNRITEREKTNEGRERERERGENDEEKKKTESASVHVYMWSVAGRGKNTHGEYALPESRFAGKLGKITACSTSAQSKEVNTHTHTHTHRHTHTIRTHTNLNGTPTSMMSAPPRSRPSMMGTVSSMEG